MIKKLNRIHTSQTFLNDLIYGLIIALLFSSFIYLEHFGFTFKLLNTISALSSLALLLYSTKRTILIAGFFIGLLWFYWIGYSFEYQGVGYMTPIITLGFSFIYLLFFGIIALSKEVFIRAILIFLLSFFEPFDWNWLQIELIFVESYIGITKYQLILVLLALSLPKYINKPFTYTPLILIIFAFNFHVSSEGLSQLKIKLVQTDIKQEIKWLKETQIPTVNMIFKQIHDGIKNDYDMIVLPESVFPFFLNEQPKLLKSLKTLSKDIVIVTGALLIEDKQHYNATYIFQNGSVLIAKKMILVPFGEYIPLPKFAKKFINETFFAGGSDFLTADRPTNFKVNNEKFRNAICYEATCQEIYDGDVKFVIATSNNAWFAPSIEPTIQNLLMRYYARKNNVTIYHSANYKGTGIIK